MPNIFERKTHGRIFVMTSADIEKVRAIIAELDGFEAEYLPEKFITVWDGAADLVYGGKFEADIDRLTTECWNRKIPILCVTGKRDPLSVF